MEAELERRKKLERMSDKWARSRKLQAFVDYVENEAVDTAQ